MLNLALKTSKKARKHNGDTIVEVLIAIAIAAFAIGTSYAISNRSLQQAITARERNEATNLSQSQISALKLRYIANKAAFMGTDATYDNPPTLGFAVKSTTPRPAASALPYTDFHFCLDEQSASSTDPSHQWTRIPNNMTDAEADNISATNKYNSGTPGCIRNISNVYYFVDISAQITAGSIDSIPRTVYKVTVRWAQVGNNSNGQSTVYYRF